MSRRALVVLLPFCLAAMVLAGTVSAGEVVPPSVTIIDGPPNGSVSGPNGSFVFTGGPQFECTLDDGDPSQCNDGTFSYNLDEGPHTFTVQAFQGGTPGASESRTWTVDATPPAISDMPEAQVVNAGDTVTYTLPTATDATPPVDVTCDPASGFTASVTVNVVCTATDAVGNAAQDSFTVTVNGPANTPPVLNLPGTITVEATSSGGAIVDYSGSVSATDAEDNPDPTPTCAPASGSTFPLGTTPVSCDVTDSGSLTDSGSFNVLVQDTTPPTFTSTPPSITVPDLDGPGESVAYSTPSATDTVDASVEVSCLPASPVSVNAGPPTTVECIASDGFNQATTSFTITVSPNGAPTVTVTAPVTVEATGPSGAPVSFTVVVEDAEDPSALSASCNPTSGSTFPLGLTTIECSAIDSGGTIGFGSAVVDVVDTTAPIVTVPGTMTVQPTSANGANVTFTASASDLVDTSLIVTCSPASGSLFSIVGSPHLVTCSTTDDAGNPASNSFSISVQDAEAPTVTVSESKTVEANGPSGAIVNYDAPTATDIVDGPIAPASIRCTKQSGVIYPLGTTLVTCSATDSDNHVGAASFTITVEDTTPPVITAPTELAVQSTSPVPVTDSRIEEFLESATATDIVDTDVEVTTNAPATFQLGTTAVVFTATDDSDNVSQKSAVVTVTTRPVGPPSQTDTVPPGNVKSIKAISGNLSVVITWKPPNAKDFDHVEITRSPGKGGQDSSLVYKGKKRAFSATGLTDGIEYRFVIVTYDKAGNRSAGIAVVALAEQRNLLSPEIGGTITGATRFAWRPVKNATYYNIQFWFKGKKQLSAHPTATHFMLPRTWRYAGAQHRLLPGTWDVYVFPGFGTKSEGRFGKLHVNAEFTVKRR
jgi:hypothetical protein